ncbi:MAG: hypothetical protein K9M45_02710, partial [Kiritimatiellales bacterium]|nr:hypothetical protein [Kiritimatiellales bacterium]
TPLRICVQFVNGAKVFINSALDYKVRPCGELEHGFEHILGEQAVYFSAKSDALLHPPKERKWNNKRKAS